MQDGTSALASASASGAVPFGYRMAPLCRFLAMGLLLHLAAWAGSWLTPKTALISLLWWSLGGSLLLVSCLRWGARVCGAAWLSLFLLFGVDIAVASVVLRHFGTTPRPGVLVQALANTQAAEVRAFIEAQAWSLLKGLSFAAGAVALGLRGRPPADVWTCAARRRLRSRRHAPMLVALVLATIALHNNRSMMKRHPLLRWSVLLAQHRDAERDIRHQADDRAAVWRDRASWALHLTDPSPRTVVVVIGESGTRFNWGLYGYSRDTTAPLARTLSSLPGRTVLWRHAWSAASTTYPSLRLALTPARLDGDEAQTRHLPDITQLAQAAGYHVSWLSNQARREGWFAAIADSADANRFVNNGYWNDSSATDDALLPVLREQLGLSAGTPAAAAAAIPPAARELIVVHLLGQHFRYAQRCPEGVGPWPGKEDDDVTRQMKAQGRAWWVRAARDDYDNAMLCGSRVLAGILALVHEARPDRAVDVLHFSDHGQDVGHQRNEASHSERAESGFAIPMLWWRRDGTASGDAVTSASDAEPPRWDERPFRLDSADHLMHALLRIRSRWYEPTLDPSSPAYAPEASMTAPPIRPAD
ncbi:phosphoethanolamine transferase [Roseateles sp. So40a]|uniref:phosphoethanolamine transferase n=1 Tax=Roseateles sp. So40a TaxID=3400226 RepID=UPI003A84F7FB